MLCHVDVEDVVKPLNEVNRLAAVHSTTLVCSWSYAEVARYIETFRLFENKTASDIKERVDPDYLSRVTGASMDGEAPRALICSPSSSPTCSPL